MPFCTWLFCNSILCLLDLTVLYVIAHLHCYIVFYCMNISHSSVDEYLGSFQVTFASIQCCFDHSCMCLLVKICTGYIPKSGIAGSLDMLFQIQWTLLHFFPKWMHLFVLSPVLYESSSCSTCWPHLILCDFFLKPLCYMHVKFPFKPGI